MIARSAACAAALLLAVTLAGCVPEPAPTPSPTPTATATPTPTPSPTTTSDATPEVQYCTEHGGTVVELTPSPTDATEHTDWTPIANPVAACRFQQGSGESASQLDVDLVTLYAEEPTMAAYAYLSKKPLPSGGDGANPASMLCMNLDGEELTLTPAGGSADAAVTACRFGDGSFIDEWAIAYYSGGVVRGADLAELFRFDPTQVPSA